MFPSRPPPNPSANKRRSAVSVSYVDYKFFTADLSQVCDCRTLMPKMKYNDKEGRAAKGSKACQDVTAAIDKLRDDIELGSLQDYLQRRASRLGRMRRRFDDQLSRSRNDTSVVTGFGDSDASRSKRSSVQGKGSRWGGDASVSARAGDPGAPRRLPSPDATASLSGGGASRSRRSSSCERTVASYPGVSSSPKASAPPYRRASSLPSEGPVDQLTAVLRRKFRPMHQCASVNRRVEGIMKPYFKYSSGAANVGAVIGNDGSAAPSAVGPAPSCRRSSLPGRDYVRKHSKDSMCSLDSTLASSGQSLWSDGTSWVPTGVEFSSNIEVYLYDT